MIDNDKYCIDILDQIKAVKNALSSVEANILKKHLAECVKDTLGTEKDFEKKVDEIIKTLKREIQMSIWLVIYNLWGNQRWKI